MSNRTSRVLIVLAIALAGPAMLALDFVLRHFFVVSERADFEALFLTTTLAQLPAVLGDVSLVLGASVAPALCSTAASVTAVLAIGLFARKNR
ncbi:MAG: hypothetical protein ABI461_15600 [Polyangiaceae bacterium]